MLNKPLGTVCSNVADGYPSVLSLLDIDKAQELLIAGRLDHDTTGLVLITDDGQWLHRVTSPNKHFGKRYRVQLADPIQPGLVELFAKGVALKGDVELTLPAELTLLSTNEVLLTLHEGRYHQVKRMFGAVGNKVIGLHREKIGAICLDNGLELGEWRYLTDTEIQSV